MNILMATNTFTPHIGGVANSVRRFTEEFRRRGHRVLVVAPEFETIESPVTGDTSQREQAAIGERHPGAGKKVAPTVNRNMFGMRER